MALLRNQAVVLNFFDCLANVLDLEDHFLLLNLTHEAATIEIRRMDRRIKDKFAAESDPKSKALVLSFFDCLANVLDLEDHFLLLNLTPGARPSAVQVPTSMHLPSLTTTPISPPGKVVCERSTTTTASILHHRRRVTGSTRSSAAATTACSAMSRLTAGLRGPSTTASNWSAPC